MWLYLVHHGEAVTPDEDPRRPLTVRGAEDVQMLATEAHARDARPAVIWHSGKLRARQTAETFWRVCNPFAEFSACRGLQPGDPPAWMRDRVAGESRDIMCVGHLPNLASLLGLLTHESHAESAWPPHGLVALEPDVDDPTRWYERWRLTTGLPAHDQPD